MKFFFLFFLTLYSITPLFSESPEELLSSFLSTMNSFESIRANVTIGSLSGSLSYKKPHHLYLKLSDGRVISANGRHLWIYNPSSAIAGKQDLKGGTGGLYGLLNGYENVSNTGKMLRLQSDKKYYEEIVITLTPNNVLKTIRMKPKGSSNGIEISLSGVQTNLGLPSSLFNYHPPSNAQIVENPLNQKE